ncbi:hypothetical protein KHQ06_28335 [Nocardia tengchongensis]|uniref:Transposase n=1 Tax=Nocardia tengchongensis TaxID=2055889 RepID=A0ABX8CL57_9NOCA|nr:hypothetical protein [Nocardia tengchongensis]QVI20127.1 hypothetical protein KHQ06_28335 [Nocardia tengchongensis]
MTPEEARLIREIGEFNGRLYRGELAARITLGVLDRKRQSEYRAARKRALTAQTSSRWAGAITRSVEDQYQLGMRGLAAHARAVDAAIAVLASRCALAPRERDGTVIGYKDTSERFGKTRRLAALRVRAERIHGALTQGKSPVVMGGKRLWRSRNHLAEAGLSEQQWRQRWDAARMFLTADGETGKTGGNETLRVAPGTGMLRIKVPVALADRLGTHLHIGTPVVFHHRRAQWHDRIMHKRSVRYDIAYDPGRDRWYLDASWGIDPEPSVPLTAIRAGKVLGVDLNAGHLATCVLDNSGNPIGAPATIALAGQGCSASRRDGHLRAGLSAVLDQAEYAGCGAIVIENLDFADARATGRDRMGRGRRGKRFRRSVAGIPTGKFRDRVRAMASGRGLAVLSVDPAYTSRVGNRCWRTPLQEQSETSGPTVTAHHGAAVAIGRRGLGVKLSRHSNGPRHPQRSVPGQPSSLASAAHCVRVADDKSCPTTGPEGRSERSGSKHHSSAAKTVRAATERKPLRSQTRNGYRR